jgi:general secretion pathway protein D
MRALRTLAVPLIALLLVSPVLGQGAAEPDKNLVIIDVAKDMELQAFLDLISKATGKPLLYDPNGQRIRNQKMGSTFSHRVPKDKLFITFRAILSFYELTLVPIGPKGYEIFLAIDSRSTNNFVKNKAVYIDHRSLPEYEDHDGLYISCAIPVQHIDNLTTLRTALSTMVSPAGIGRVHEVPGSNNIIIMDFAPTVAAMAKLIAHMDVESPTKRMVMEFVTLEHAYAEEVADIISELVAVQRQANVPARRGSTRVASSSPEPRIIAYEPKNALVVASTQDDFLRIQTLIDRFDQPGEQSSLVEVIRLNHVQAEDVADTLTQVLEGLGGQLSSQGAQPVRPGQRPRGSGTQRTGGSSQEMEPQVVPDPATNSLILAADTRTIRALKDIIELDMPKDQVLIEASLIALIRTDDFQLGVELVGVNDKGLNQGSTSGFGVTNFGLSTFEDTDGDLIPDINVPTALQSGGGGLVAGIFRNGGIPIMLTALQQLNNAKVLSMPSVVTYDNSAATLQSLQDAAVGSQAELSSGSLQQGFDGYESAGVTLVVSPHISADEYLRLDIELEVSSFQGDTSVSSTGLPPPRQRNIINTTIALPNEHTVVMGGLIGEDETLSESKVPLLGDIPVLGYLFKNKTRTKVKRNLFIFVTPHILRQRGVDFTELHKQTWIAKMKADELIEHIEIHNANFKLDPRVKDPEDLGQAMLDVSSHIDAGRFQEVPSEIALQELQSLRRQVPGLAQKEIDDEARDD